MPAKRWRRVTILVLGSAVVLGVAALAPLVLVEGVAWRASIVASKLKGDFGDIDWRELLGMLRPGSAFYLERMASTKSPYNVIRNPLTSDNDVRAGAAVFRARCAACHGADGTGGTGPGIIGGSRRKGDSDWALYRTVSRGVPATAMQPQGLSPSETWQTIAYIRSLSRERLLDRFQAPEMPLVTSRRLVEAAEEPAGWLMYSGSYASHRYSPLSEITPDNVGRLRLHWVVQMATLERFVEATPVVNGAVMYVTEPPSNILALDARSGRLLWSYRRALPETLSICCERVNRGVALAGSRVYVGTLDAHLVALEARTGRVSWDVEVADPAAGYSITAAPLAVNDKILTGVSGGDFGIRGFLDAYDAASGKRLWRFYTVPAPGEPGHDTWSGDSWKTGGAPTWLTGSFDPVLNLVYWTTGNPAPIFRGDLRQGDNLYSNSVVAVDADSGTLKWHFQFTPGDEHDWDANQIPVLADAPYRGRSRKLLLLANRNGFYYVLDREDGEFLSARAFARQTWAAAIDARGRPIVRDETRPSRKGTLTWPGIAGATNWWAPTYSVRAGLFYVPVLERAGIFFKGAEPTYTPGRRFGGSASESVTDVPHWTAVRALAPQTGELRWEYRLPPRTTWAAIGGLLSTAGNVLFGGDGRVFFALDALTGRELWKTNLGGTIHAGPMSYAIDGRQQVAIAAGRAVFVFQLGDRPQSAAASDR